jgi:hypothetical protein
MSDPKENPKAAEKNMLPDEALEKVVGGFQSTEHVAVSPQSGSSVSFTYGKIGIDYKTQDPE